jgi:hypothetical protein
VYLGRRQRQSLGAHAAAQLTDIYRTPLTVGAPREVRPAAVGHAALNPAVQNGSFKSLIRSSLLP